MALVTEYVDIDTAALELKCTVSIVLQAISEKRLSCYVRDYRNSLLMHKFIDPELSVLPLGATYCTNEIPVEIVDNDDHYGSRSYPPDKLWFSTAEVSSLKEKLHTGGTGTDQHQQVSAVTTPAISVEKIIADGRAKYATDKEIVTEIDNVIPGLSDANIGKLFPRAEHEEYATRRKRGQRLRGKTK